MVRAYHPQSFAREIVTNTNYPPQRFDESQSGNISGFEAIGETELSFLSEFGTQGDGDGEFDSPNQVTFDSVTTQQMMVTDANAGDGRVQFFDINGNFQGKIDLTLGTTRARGVGVHPINGRYYVGNDATEIPSRQIEVFNTNKTFNFSFGSFQNINDVEIGPSTNVYALDDIQNIDTSRVKKFDDAGNFILEFDLPDLGNGPGDGRGFGIDSKENLYVADRINEVIQVFDSNGGGTDPGTPIAILGGPGSGPGQFDNIQSVTLDNARNRIITTETVNDRIQLFDLNFNHIISFTNSGNWVFPLGVSFFDDNTLFVSDRQRDNVTIVGVTETFDDLLYDEGGGGDSGKVLFEI